MAAEFISGTLTHVGQAMQAAARPQVAGRPEGDEQRQAEVVPFRKSKERLSETAVSRLVQNLNESSQYLQRAIQFNVDRESGRTIIKVVDTQTDEVIRQIPPEEVVRLAKRMQEYGGVLLRTQA